VVESVPGPVGPGGDHLVLGRAKAVAQTPKAVAQTHREAILPWWAPVVDSHGGFSFSGVSSGLWPPDIFSLHSFCPPYLLSTMLSSPFQYQPGPQILRWQILRCQPIRFLLVRFLLVRFYLSNRETLSNREIRSVGTRCRPRREGQLRARQLRARQLIGRLRVERLTNRFPLQSSSLPFRGCITGVHHGGHYGDSMQQGKYPMGQGGSPTKASMRPQAGGTRAAFGRGTCVEHVQAFGTENGRDTRKKPGV